MGNSLFYGYSYEEKFLDRELSAFNVPESIRIAYESEHNSPAFTKIYND